MTYKEIKRKVNHFAFVWAITEVLTKGMTKMCSIKDEYIEKAYQNEIERQNALPDGEICIYTPECVRDMLKTARELAKLEISEFINGLVVDDIWKAHPISWDRMCEIASKSIDGLMEDDEESAKEYLQNEVELDESEAEYFGVEFDEESEDEEDECDY